jgi:hypothetical protein
LHDTDICARTPKGSVQGIASWRRRFDARYQPVAYLVEVPQRSLQMSQRSQKAVILRTVSQHHVHGGSFLL